jgi:5-methyltetrahydropteroyltriglutamate--homocysteine methyltransferase
MSGFGVLDEPGPVAVPSWRQRFCVGPVEWRDFAAVERDIAALSAAVAAHGADEAFMTSPAPFVAAVFFPNRYYADDDEYRDALTRALRREYEAIVDAGFVLQLDCPHLGEWNLGEQVSAATRADVAEVRRNVAAKIETVNTALAGLPRDRIRIHVCWGGGENARDTDTELQDVADLLVTVHAGAIMLMAANGRHEHEWKVWRDVELPDDMVVVAGVIDSTTNVVEHPEVVADRIEAYCSVIGRERFVAGVDCGFACAAEMDLVAPENAWKKLHSLGEGARRATERLW